MGHGSENQSASDKGASYHFGSSFVWKWTKGFQLQGHCPLPGPCWGLQTPNTDFWLWIYVLRKLWTLQVSSVMSCCRGWYSTSLTSVRQSLCIEMGCLRWWNQPADQSGKFTASPVSAVHHSCCQWQIWVLNTHMFHLMLVPNKWPHVPENIMTQARINLLVNPLTSVSITLKPIRF